MPEEREVLTMAENVRLTAEQRTAMIDDIIRMLKEIGRKEAEKLNSREIKQA